MCSAACTCGPHLTKTGGISESVQGAHGYGGNSFSGCICSACTLIAVDKNFNDIVGGIGTVQLGDGRRMAVVGMVIHHW